MVAKKAVAPKRKYVRKAKEVKVTTWFQKAVKAVSKFFSKGK